MDELRLRIEKFLSAVVRQDRAALRSCFLPTAVVRWPNTDEEFDLEDYLTANCDYPGQWRGEVERVEETGTGALSVARVWTAEGSAAFHVVSLFRFGPEGRIGELTEYYSDDGPAPRWRQELGLGRPIEKMSEE